MLKPRHIVITRPRGDAEKTAIDVAEAGFASVIEPLLTIHDVDAVLPVALEACQGLVFSSANAVRAFGRRYASRDLPVYAVGEQTADAARQAGFGTVRSAGGDALDLVELVARHAGVEKPLLYLCGAHKAKPVDDLLRARRYDVHSAIVYRAEAVSKLSESFLSLIDRGDVAAIMFFSARTAETFSMLIGRSGREAALSAIKALCLGESVLKSLRPLPFAGVYVAAQPDAEGMKKLLCKV